jgi:hypothetical protein
MSEDPDFDTEIETAWSRFCVRLCTYLENMSSGDLLTICPGGGHRRDDLYLTITGKIEGRLIGDAAMNGTLAASISFDDTELLAEQGWQEYDIGDGLQRTFAFEANADAVAHAVIVLVRDVRGIAHPSFLAASSVGAPVTTVFDSGSQLEDWVLDPSRTRLVADVESALESITGSVPMRDEDGDIPFETGEHVAYVRLLDSEPVVEMYVAFPIGSHTHTVDSILAELSLLWPDIKFQANHTHVVASTRVDCAPVVEEHLGRRLGMFLRFVEEQGDEIAAGLMDAPVRSLRTSTVVSDSLRLLKLSDMDAAALNFAINYEARAIGLHSQMLHDALALASAAHLYQRRTGSRDSGTDPSIVHPLRNVLRLLRFGCSDDIVLTATALHDTVEDQTERVVSILNPGMSPTRPNAIDLIARHFSPSVSYVVDAVTNPAKPHGLSAAQKNEAYRDHVALVVRDPRAFLVKLSDFIDNAGSLHHVADSETRKRLRDKYVPVVEVFLEARAQLRDELNLTVEGQKRLDARLERLARALDSTS